MYKYILLMLLVFGLNSSISLAATTGSAFSYQGELTDNGSPANGDYDITVSLFPNLTGGSSVMDESFPDTPVVNGLFNLRVDFGDVVYENSDIYYIEIEITPSSGGATSVLAPRNELLAVPYAVQAQYLAPGTATNGDVLSFDGNNWVPASAGGSSPWNVSGSTLTSPGRVGVGEPTPSAQLHVTNNTGQISLLKVDDVSDTRMVIQATGKTGIGTTGPTDRLHVRSSAGEDPLRVQIENSTKLRVHQNGGTSLGVNSPTNTPDNGLYVAGDVKQSENSNGMLKYMFRATCDATPTIDGEYNGTNVTGTATISRNNVGNCTINLPINIQSNFISATAIRAVSGDNRVIGCVPFLTGMVCQLSVGSTAASIDGGFHVLIY